MTPMNRMSRPIPGAQPTAQQPLSFNPLGMAQSAPQAPGAGAGLAEAGQVIGTAIRNRPPRKFPNAQQGAQLDSSLNAGDRVA